jgi:hypothetical protein
MRTKRFAPGKMGTPPVCVNTQSSVANCGGCGIKCEAGQVCGATGCGCPGSFDLCGADDSGAGGKCTNTKTDRTNCGTCGNDCGNKACHNGGCAP